MKHKPIAELVSAANSAHVARVAASCAKRRPRRPYPLTMKALSIVDAHIAPYEALWDRSWTEEEIAFCTHVEFMRSDYVRQAFAKDTEDRNRWSQVRVMSVDDIRKIVNAPRTVTA